MDNTSRLNLVNGCGWTTGFGNLFRESSAGFWHTKKWVIQTIVLLFFFNAILVNMWSTPADMISELLESYRSSFSIDLLVQNELGTALMNFFLYAAIVPAIVAIIAGQDALIGERQSGTAAWVLSKPITRAAFILSKMAASTIGLFITGVVIPGVAAYIQISAWSGTAWSMGFFGALGLVFLNLLFYLTLTYMLGAIFNNRAIVLGISLAMAVGGPFYLYSIPVLNQITPWTILMPLGGGMSAAMGMTFGLPPEPILPVIGTAVLCLVFIVVTILRFSREEF